MPLSDATLRRQIANMLMVGFDEAELSPETPIYRQIADLGLGGVILFDRFYDDPARVKNVQDPAQLQRLSVALQEAGQGRLLIAIDQEGGRIERLKPAYGFVSTPSAQVVAASGEEAAKEAYAKMAKMLCEHGINCDFAPDVDLAINDANGVIVGLERSYGKAPETVARYGGIFCDALNDAGLLAVLKHFPGHGSSLGDSHEGFVDVTETWDALELEPYRLLIEAGKADMLMTAHVFNRDLDPRYPATLSYAVTTRLLREQLGFRGVVISDDLQMKAIASHYTREEAVVLSVNAGVDMLLFCNQLGQDDAAELIELIVGCVEKGTIARSRIEASSNRIDALKARYLHCGSSV